MDALKQEYARLTLDKKKLYQNYHAAKDRMKAMLTAKSNVDTILREPKRQNREREIGAR